MRKFLISKIELEVTNEGEILRMGGPWMGDVSMGTQLISTDCMVDNFLYKKDMNLLFFVKFHSVSKTSWYFTINFYNIDNKSLYQFEEIFDMVYLKEFVGKNELVIYNSFNDSDQTKRRIFDIDIEEFNQV